MPKTPEINSAVLAVLVGSTSATEVGKRRSTAGTTSRVTLIRAMLADTGGVDIDSAPATACCLFTQWTDAVASAVGLTARVEALPAEFAGIGVQIGLDVVTAPPDAAAVARVARIAALADSGAICLGARLADLVRDDPPERFVVRALDARGSTAAAGVEHLMPATEVVPTNLEPQRASFVGRESDMAAIAELLDRGRLVTVTGPPGIGKSRLAAEICLRRLGRYAGGAWFLPLAPLTDPQLVWPALATTLGAATGPRMSPVAAIAAHVGTRRTLVVMDNFEHLGGATDQLADMIALVPALQVIVTSQVWLGLPEESEYRLVPLDTLPPRSGQPRFGITSAAALFADRASTAAPGFSLNSGNVTAVTDICRRLDGLPLAIELAAARMRVLSLDAIAARLGQRLAILAGGPADQPERHRSLRAAIDWSYELLDPSVQDLFRRLSVFRGGWTVDGAAAVAGSSTVDTILDRLVALLDASLINRDGSGDGDLRFSMLESLRAFGTERLEEAGEADLARGLQAQHELAIATRLGPELLGPNQASALDQIASEHDNIRAALAHLLVADPLAALRMSAAIWRFWQIRGHLDEGANWMAKALEAVTEASDADLASAHAAAGGLAYWRGDLVETEHHYDEVVALRRLIGDDVGIADALFDLAFVYDPSLRPPPEDVERTAAGIRIAEEAHERYEQAGHEPGIAKSEWLLGSIKAGRDLDGAQALLRSSVERFRRIGDPFGLGWALHSYGLTLVGTGDSGAASNAFGEALGMFAAASDSSATALLLDDFAEVAKADGDATRMARLKGASAGLRHATQSELAVANAPWLLDKGVPRGLVDEAAIQRAWRDGQTMSQAEAVAYALGSQAIEGPSEGLRIHALGPLQVERDGQPVSDWGGPKAGSRHALAIFAFLLDRGMRGVTKDECIEVLWPETEMHQADLNFHRTLSGLRSTLRPPGNPGPSVVLSSGRYRLVESLVGWLDESEFEARLLHAAESTDDLAAIRGLEAARLLYRGDYLDDCPLYGDSDDVEGHRRRLRNRLVDALVDLGRRYEARRDDALASARFQEAIAMSGGDCPSAAAGLQRLGIAEA